MNLPQILQKTQARAQSLQGKLGEHVPGEVMVKLPPGASVESFQRDYGSSLLENFRLPEVVKSRFGGQLVHLKLPEGVSTAQAMAAMQEDPRVLYAVPNDILRKSLREEQWNLHNVGQKKGKPDADIDAPEAWSQVQASSGVILATVDTGLDSQHPAMANRLWTNPEDGTHGYNVLKDNHDPFDDDNHGTHCTGIAGANGYQGLEGVSPNCQHMAIKFLDGNGSGSTSGALKGILFAVEHGAKVTNNSYGGKKFNQAFYDMLAASPALHVCASGNENDDNDTDPTYPASYDLPNVISVAASDRHDRLVGFSNYGATSVDLAAPGLDIFSSVPGGGMQSMDGTSQASPHVAGAAATIMAEYPEAGLEEVRARLLYGVDDVPSMHGKVASGGRLNLATSLKPDHGPPGPVQELAAQDLQPGRATLSWRAAGDDGQENGKAARYQIRWSDQPITNLEEFERARQLTAPATDEPGTLQTLSIDLPVGSQDKNYYFALRSSDKIGQYSELSTTVATLPGTQVAFQDNGDPNLFETQGWGQTARPEGGTCWTDSPNGNYGPNSKSWIRSKPIALKGLEQPRLHFETRYQTEYATDFVHFEISGDGGKSWKKLRSYEGQSDWKLEKFDLAPWKDKTVQFRFRLQTDGSVEQDGFSFANFVVAEGLPLKT